VQITPPGSPTSIIFGAGVAAAELGPVERLVVAVYDGNAARMRAFTPPGLLLRYPTEVAAEAQAFPADESALLARPWSTRKCAR
jgi:hypothetical protein